MSETNPTLFAAYIFGLKDMYGKSGCDLMVLLNYYLTVKAHPTLQMRTENKMRSRYLYSGALLQLTHTMEVIYRAGR